MIEAPIQSIYTLTLIALGYLDTPQKSSRNKKLILQNSFGLSVSLSFLPMMSLAFSFLAIVVNAGRGIMILDIWKKEKKAEVVSWILLLISTSIFRIQV
jgi:hypothetical protein